MNARALTALAVLLVWGMAAAQGQPGECPQAAPGAGEVTLTAFLPNAPCLMAQTVLLTAKWGLWEAIAKVGLTMTAGLAMLQLFLAARSGMEKALMPVVIAIVVSSLLVPTTQGTGAVRALQVEVLSQVRGVYNASATLGNAALSNGPSSVASTTARLGEKIAELLARTQHASVVEMQLQAAKTARDPAFEDPGLAQKLYADAVAKSNEGISFTGGTGGPNWIFNAGYLLLYGFFAIYAGIIWVVWVTLVITVMLLPILMALCVMGNFKGLMGAGYSVMGTVLVIALMPPFTALTATITIGIPGMFLEQRVNTINADVAASLTRYQNALASGCGKLDGGCVLRRDVVLPMQADLASMKETATWAILAVVCLFVALSIGSTMLRRIPATVMGMFSLPGGGESSGVETDGLSKVLGGLAKMSGASAAVSAGQRALGQKMLGAGSSGKDSGKEGGGAEAKSSGGAGSGAVPSPSVTSGAGPSGSGSGGGGASNVPPASVTGTDSGRAGGSPAGSGSPASAGFPSAAGSTGGASVGVTSGAGASPSGGVTPAPAPRSAVGRGIAAVQAAKANPVGTAKAGLQTAAAKTGAAIGAAAFSPQERERFANARQTVSDIKADVSDFQEARSAAREEASWTRAAAVPAPANPDASEASPVRQGAHPNPTAVAQNARAGGADGPQNRQAMAGLQAGGKAGEYSGNVTVSQPVTTSAHPVAGGGTPPPAAPPAPVTPAPVTPVPASPRNERRQGVVTAAPVQGASEWKPTPAPAAPATPASAPPARVGLRPVPAQPARVQAAPAPQASAGNSTPAPAASAAPAPVQPAPAPVIPAPVQAAPAPVQPASAGPAPAPVTPKADDTEVRK